jgi:hypothetical protein
VKAGERFVFHLSPDGKAGERLGIYLSRAVLSLFRPRKAGNEASKGQHALEKELNGT